MKPPGILGPMPKCLELEAAPVGTCTVTGVPGAALAGRGDL
jgi:hypothetical protein